MVATAAKEIGENANDTRKTAFTCSGKFTVIVTLPI
jgi:hypothetical protein